MPACTTACRVASKDNCATRSMEISLSLEKLLSKFCTIGATIRGMDESDQGSSSLHIPERPAIRASKKEPTSFPKGVIAPRPVATTRLIYGSTEFSRCRASFLSNQKIDMSHDFSHRTDRHGII